MMHKKNINLFILCFVAILFLIAGYLFSSVITAQRTDYFAHIDFTRKMVQEGWPQTPHFIYHVILVVMSYLLGGGISIEAAKLTTGLIIFILGFQIYFAFFYIKTTTRWWAPFFNGFVVFGILILMPIPALKFLDDHLYFGYIGVNVLHNPTIVLLKPFALAITLLFCRILDTNSEKINKYIIINMLTLAFLVVISALIKPNFVLCFVPAILIFAILHWRLFLRKKTLYLVVIFSAIVALGWQYIFIYYGKGQSSGVRFAPFLVYKMYSDGWMAPFKLLLSIAFPLAIILFNFKAVSKIKIIEILSLCFIVSLLTFYLMAEYPVPYSGNFSWGAQVILFLLFIVTASFFSNKVLLPLISSIGFKTFLRFEIYVPSLLFIAHVISGAYYYYNTVIGMHW